MGTVKGGQPLWDSSPVKKSEKVNWLRIPDAIPSLRDSLRHQRTIWENTTF